MEKGLNGLSYDKGKDKIDKSKNNKKKNSIIKILKMINPLGPFIDLIREIEEQNKTH